MFHDEKTRILLALTLALIAGCGNETYRSPTAAGGNGSGDAAKNLNFTDPSDPAGGEPLTQLDQYRLSVLPRLAVGGSQTFDVVASWLWNFSISVQAGEVYSFQAAPSSTWTDLVVTTDPDGFASTDANVPLASRPVFRATEAYRRLPAENWFKLSGCIGLGNQQCFPVGRAATRTMTATGPLTLFANDLPVMYGNNLGKIRVTVLRIK